MSGLQDMSTTPSEDPHLPDEIRPDLFALTELMSELFIITRGYFRIDLESIEIQLCVNHATMKPFMLAESGPFLSDAEIEGKRGSISRRAIAEKTGLPRETVRRKVQAMLELGILVADENDQIQSASRLRDPHARNAVLSARAAVDRYHERQRQFAKP